MPPPDYGVTTNRYDYDDDDDRSRHNKDKPYDEIIHLLYNAEKKHESEQ